MVIYMYIGKREKNLRYLYSPLKMLDLLLMDGDSDKVWNINLC